MLVLRVRHKGQLVALEGVSPQATVAELQASIEKATGVGQRCQVLKFGFPYKRVPDSAVGQKISDLGCRNRDTVALEERPEPPAPGTAAVADLPPPLPGDRIGNVTRHIIEADNSCLFNAIAYLLKGPAPTARPRPPEELRETVAATIANDAAKWDVYTQAESSKSVPEYVEWIKRAESWGGALELNVLSEVLGVQLSAVCVRSLRVEHFPDKGPQKHRAYLMYDGIHYDAVVATAEGAEVRVFDPADDLTLSKVMALAAELQESKQFTDTANFTLQCQHCFAKFRGQPDAQKHGQETGHFNFQEVGG